MARCDIVFEKLDMKTQNSLWYWLIWKLKICDIIRSQVPVDMEKQKGLWYCDIIRSQVPVNMEKQKGHPPVDMEKKVCDELCSQVPYRWANETKFNPAWDLNLESPDGPMGLSSIPPGIWTQNLLMATAAHRVLLKQDLSAQSSVPKTDALPMSHWSRERLWFELIFVIFCFVNTFSKVTGKTGQGWLW